MNIAECIKSNSCEKLEILSGDSIEDKLEWAGWTVNGDGCPVCPECSPLKLSDASKLAGFKSAVQIVELAGVSRASLYIDFDSRFSPRKIPSLPGHFRRAMDEKHRRERAKMELALVEIMKK